MMRTALKEIMMYWHDLFIVLICLAIDRTTLFQASQEYYTKIPVYAIYIVCTILSYLIFAIQIYRKENINRLILGLSLFSSIASLAWLINIPCILYYYNNYGYFLPFVFIMAIGLLMAIFTQGSFIGILSDNKKAVRIASLKLFAATILAALFSFYTGIITLALFSLALYDWKLRYAITGGGNKAWKFKW